MRTAGLVLTALSLAMHASGVQLKAQLRAEGNPITNAQRTIEAGAFGALSNSVRAATSGTKSNPFPHTPNLKHAIEGAQEANEFKQGIDSIGDGFKGIGKSAQNLVGLIGAAVARKKYLEKEDEFFDNMGLGK